MSGIVASGALGLLLTLAGCGGGGGGDGASVNSAPASASFAIGGTVSGLQGVAVLQKNGGDDLSVSGNGSFAFSTPLQTGQAYQIAVRTQPTAPSQSCTVASAVGTVGSGPVTNVAVTCTTDTYRVGGSISGLTGTGLVLQNNGGDDLPAAAGSTTFTFPGSVVSGAPYFVTVKSQPTNPAETCSVSSPNSGPVGSSDVVNVAVTCTAIGPLPCQVGGDPNPGSVDVPILRENGTVISHTTNITSNETWAGDGTVHVVPNSIAIVAPATVAIESCATVKLAPGASIDVRGDVASGAIAKLVSAGDSIHGPVLFQGLDRSRVPTWGRLRGLNKNSLIELQWTWIFGGGNVGGSQLNAVISMNGSSELPDPVLKAIGTTIIAPAGTGIYFSDAAFTSDSDSILTMNASHPFAMPAMALGSIPAGFSVHGIDANGDYGTVKVVENPNIFSDLSIRTYQPILFTSDVHVGGLAPAFRPNVTLTLEHGVVLKFAKTGNAPPLVTFGDGGQSTDKNAALVVRGPVLLTSGASSPAPGDWAGIWLRTSNGSHIDQAIIEYAGGDAGIGPRNCAPFDSSVNHQAAHIAALLVGDETDQQYVPPADLITNTIFRNNAGNFAIDSVWQAPFFGPSLNATNVFGNGPRFCTQSKNLIPLGCFVNGVDQSGCLVP